MTSRPTVALLLAAALLVGVACSERPGIDSAGAVAETTTTVAVVNAVLTGLPVSPEIADRPAVTVKVDNAPAARPQSGLEAADVVFEERVEGGITRFLAVYQSQDVDLVGPIRSIRGSDVGVVSMIGGVFTFSSGPGHVVRQLRGHPVTAVSELDGADPFIYPPGRRRPLMTFGATTRLREEAPPDANLVPRIFEFLADGEEFAVTAEPATSVHVVFGRSSGGFTWDASTGRWLRTSDGRSHLLDNGTRLSATNVIVQPVSYKRAGYNDSSGFPVDQAVLVGEGEAIALAAGRQVPVRWSKESLDGPIRYTLVDGSPLRLPPGSTWVMLPAAGSTVTVS